MKVVKSTSKVTRKEAMETMFLISSRLDYKQIHAHPERAAFFERFVNLFNSMQRASTGTLRWDYVVAQIAAFNREVMLVIDPSRPEVK